MLLILGSSTIFVLDVANNLLILRVMVKTTVVVNKDLLITQLEYVNKIHQHVMSQDKL